MKFLLLSRSPRRFAVYEVCRCRLREYERSLRSEVIGEFLARFPILERSKKKKWHYKCFSHLNFRKIYCVKYLPGVFDNSYDFKTFFISNNFFLRHSVF